ncbi:MAG: rhomboid family intramembrane serine protease [Desulfobacteraceae bacterium]|jgi:membrane associated rhomboid family serine protease
MLIIPLTGKISKQNPPIVTILLILINCFVFFIFQWGDDEKYRKAFEFYLESGLAKMEVTRYRDYIIDTRGEGSIPRSLGRKELSDDAFMRLYPAMQRDKVFMKKLLNDEIITTDDPDYGPWKSLRIHFEAMKAQTVGQKYGFKPADRSLVNTFTHMFLHASFLHLLGNMVFLWLVGCVLELGCGRAFYLTLYLLTGVASVWFFGLVYMSSATPLVGASGAISGLMGAFTVLYGKKKIKVFYTLGFYFNYAKVAGIALLPVWIGKEIFQLLFGGFSHVAYVAHIGGLASGAILGLLNLKFLGQASEEVFGEDPREKIPHLLEAAMQRIGKLDMDSARPLLEEILEIDPHNKSALTHLFNVDKLNPRNARFHKTASRLFDLLVNDGKAHQTLYVTYREYRHLSKKLKLSPDLTFRIATTFSAHGYFDESARIMDMFLKKRPGYQDLPNGILRLGQAYLKNGMKKRGKQCLQIVCKRFPGTAESKIARQLLTSSS